MKQGTFPAIEYGCRRKRPKREAFLSIMDGIIP